MAMQSICSRSSPASWSAVSAIARGPELASRLSTTSHDRGPMSEPRFKAATLRCEVENSKAKIFIGNLANLRAHDFEPNLAVEGWPELRADLAASEPAFRPF